MAARNRAMLSRQDWLVAGQQLLREGGITCVKLSALTSALGVTTGSFYHHFEDFGTYLDALADAYVGDVALDALQAAAAEEPRDRIRLLFRLRGEWDVPPLDHAMRVWADSNARAAAAVTRLDHAFMVFLEQAFLDLGFDGDEARVRSLLAFSAGAGAETVHPPWPGDADDFERALELLTGRS
jgi:AcrR family transcriptional regulator